MNKLATNEKIQLVGLLFLYILANTFFGGIVGILGYIFLSVLKVKVMARKIFLFWMIILGFAIGVSFAVRYYKTVLQKVKSKT